MSLGTRLRISAEKLLHDYTEYKGMSSDPYNDHHQFHPMAEGKFLLALAALARSRVFTCVQFKEHASQSLERLESHAIPRANGHAYGLNFAYGELPADEPYVITTAIVAHGLLECAELFADSEVLHQLITGCSEYLVDVECLPVNNGLNIFVPVYSPHNRVIIYNAVAYWAMVLHKDPNLSGTHYDETLKVAKWLARDCLMPFGWPYEHGSARYDLLHTCFVLNSLAAILPGKYMEKIAIPVLAQFTGFNGYIDKFDSGHHDWAISVCTRSSSVVARFHPEQAIIYHNKTARAWALGELLVFMAAMAEQGQHKAYWTTMMKRTAATTLHKLDSNSDEGDMDKPWFRYTMFLAHGFSRVLEVLRKS